MRTIIEVVMYHENELGERTGIRVIERLGVGFRIANTGAVVLGPGNITCREKEVLELVKRGKVNKEIAQELGISARTVKAHVSALLLKFSVNSRAEMLYALSMMEAKETVEGAVEEAQKHFVGAR